MKLVGDFDASITTRTNSHRFAYLSEHLLASFCIFLVRNSARLCLLFIDSVRPDSRDRRYSGLFYILLRCSDLLPPLCNICYYACKIEAKVRTEYFRFHTISNHSAKVAAFGNQLDYLGIVILMWGSTIPTIYYGFYCDKKLQVLYCTMVRLSSPRAQFYVLADQI